MRYVRNAIMSVLTVALAFGGFLPLAARAAQLTGFSDTMSTLSAGANANHSVLFVTPSGVDAPSDTITVTLGSGGSFNLSSIVAGDVDFGVDSSSPFNDCVGPFAEKTLAASASSGVWGAAVLGQVLTLTPPTDAVSGEVASGRCVRTLIGTNSTVPSAGTNRIINPSAGQYSLAVGGGFGDSGYFTFSILGSSDVMVTASVEDLGGGGGGGAPPPPVAPTIINVRVQNLTETSVDVLWDTDVASSSTVNYGTTVSYGSQATAGGNTFNHSVPLTGLTAGTTYHFRVRSTGVGTPEGMSGDYTFMTPDTTPPIISNVVVSNIRAYQKKQQQPK